MTEFWTPDNDWEEDEAQNEQEDRWGIWQDATCDAAIFDNDDGKDEQYVRFGIMLTDRENSPRYVEPAINADEGDTYLFPSLTIDSDGVDKYYVCRLNMEKAGLETDDVTMLAVAFIYAALCVELTNGRDFVSHEMAQRIRDEVRPCTTLCNEYIEFLNNDLEDWQEPLSPIDEYTVDKIFEKAVCALTEDKIERPKRNAFIKMLDEEKGHAGLIKGFRNGAEHERAKFVQDIFHNTILAGIAEEDKIPFAPLPPMVIPSHVHNKGGR